MKKIMFGIMSLLVVGCFDNQSMIDNNEIKINDTIYEIERYEETFAQIEYERKDEENEIVITLPEGVSGWRWIAPYANEAARLSKEETIALREYDGKKGPSNDAQQYTYQLLNDDYVCLLFKNARNDEIFKNMSFNDTKADFTLEIVVR